MIAPTCLARLEDRLSNSMCFPKVRRVNQAHAACQEGRKLTVFTGMLSL